MRGGEGRVLTARILIAAGSDSGGGAGIQADIKTVTMLGGFAMTAITAVTVQNTLGVSGVHAVPPTVVRAQIDAVLSDIGADAVKIGMLGDAATVNAVADALRPWAMPIVLDPVMVAKGGAALLQAEAVRALVERLLPMAALITPNLPELAVLTGRAVATETDMVEAARALVAMGARAVLAKGGHLEGERVVDWLVRPDSELRFEGERIHTASTHGTGCTLASAIATGLGDGLDMPHAVERGRAFVREALLAAPGFGRGHGPMGHAAVRVERLP